MSGKRPRPILMIPLRRCGSHALRLRLNMSPEFYSPYPLHIVDFMPLVKLYGDLVDDDAYFQMVVDVIGLQTASMVKWTGVVFDPVDVFERLKDRPRSVHAVVWELLLLAGVHHDAGVVMDKSLDSVHYADELLQLFDDFRFLNVVRDPRAQISSMNRAIIHDFDTLLNARAWVAAYDVARALAARHPDRVLTVRYEDFLHDQESILRAICSFLQIEYLPSMVDISGSNEARRISARSSLWESNSSPPIAAHVDKFKATLGPDEIAVIETLAGVHMDHYGYERMTSRDIEITPEMTSAATARSEARRRQAWIDLRTRDPHDYCLRMFRADTLAMIRNRLERDHRVLNSTGRVTCC
jgi:hypothetical protein